MTEPVIFTISGKGAGTVLNDLQAILDKVAAVTARYNQLQNTINTLASRSKAGAAGRADLAQTLTGDPTKVAEALKQTRKELDLTQKELNKLNRVAATVKIAPDDSPIIRNRQQIEKLTASYLNLSAKAKEGTRGQNLLERLKKNAEELKKGLEDVNKALGKTEKGSGVFGGFLKTLGTVFKFQAASIVIDTIVQSIKDAIATTIEFEKEVVNLGALLNADEKSGLANLQQQALDLGRSTAFTAIEVVKLQTELVKLGYKPNEIIQSTKALVDFSVAVRESADRVALLTGATIKAFNLTALDTVRVVDALTRATVQSALSFSYLETALPTVSAAAATAGVSLEELLGVLGVLADRGVPASTAATSFRNILIESSKAGLDYREALELLNNSQSKLATAFDLFGKRGAVQAIILANSMKEVDKQTNNLADTFNTKMASAAQIAEEQLSSLDGRITLLSSAWNGFTLSIGGTDWAKGIIDGTTGILNGFSAMIEGTVDFDVYLRRLLGYGGNFVAAGQAVAEIAKNVLNVQDATVAAMQEQARLNKGLFAEANGNWEEQVKRGFALRNLLVDKLRVAYEATGLSFEAASKKARKFYDEQAESIRKLQREQQKLIVEEELDLLKFGKADIEGVKTLDSATQLVEAFTDAVKRADQTTPRFQKLLALQNDALRKEAELAANIKRNSFDPSTKSFLEDAESRLGKLQKQLESTNNAALQLDLLRATSNLQKLINDQKNIYNTLIKGITDEQLRNASDLQKQQAIEFLKNKIETENIIGEITIRKRAESEAQANKEIEILRNEQDKKLLERQIVAYQDNEEEFNKFVAQLQKKGEEGITLKIELQTIKINDKIDQIAASQKRTIFETATNETDRKSGIDLTDLTAQAVKNEMIIKQLQLRKALSETLGADNIKFTEEQQAQLDLAILQNLEYREQLRVLKAQTDLKSGEKLSEIDLKELEQLITLQKELETGQLKGKKGSFFRAIAPETAEEVAERLKTVIQANAEIARLTLAIEVELNAIRQAERDKDLAAIEVHNKKIKELEYKKGEERAKIQKATEDDVTQQLKERQRLERQLREQLFADVIDLAKEFGEGLGEALVNGDSLKDAMKKTLTDLVDLLAEFYIAQLAIQLKAAFSAAPFSAGQIARIIVSIAGVKVAAGLAKQAIKSYEKGGPIGNRADSAGGIVQGPSHKRGGVKYKYRNEILELEGGEIVINKRSASIYRKELSRINSYNGYGRKFETGGIITTVPQVLQPKVESVSIDERILMQQAELIADRVSSSQIQVLLQQNAALVEALSLSLNTNNRLKERISIAKQNSKV